MKKTSIGVIVLTCILVALRFPKWTPRLLKSLAGILRSTVYESLSLSRSIPEPARRPC